MKKNFLVGLTTGLFLVGLVGVANSTLIDFQSEGGAIQAGYTAVTGTNQTVDGITFSFTGNLYDRNPGSSDAGAFTFSDLYNDFVYINSAGPLALTLDGLAASTQYDIRFYSSDRFDAYFFWATDMVNTFTPVVGSGSAVSTIFDRTSDPLSNQQNSVLGTFLSSAGGTLSFDITGVLADADQIGQPFVRLNGLDITKSTPTPAPEPISMLLFGTGLIGLAGRQIRRRKK